MPSGRRVTLERVALQAGVSLATASRVLSAGPRAVHPDLREKVLRVAEELHYIPNGHAQALAGASSRTVGVITHDVADPYFSGIADGVMRVAHDQQQLVMMASTFRDPEREIAYVSTLHAQRARAILLIGSGFEDRSYVRRMAGELRAYQDNGGRIAFVSNHSRRLPGDVVSPDNFQGAADMASALLGMGHRRYGIISGPDLLTTVRDRLNGFRARLAAAGIDHPDSHLIVGDFTRDGGYTAMRQLLERDLDMTAVFVLNDAMAIGALSACRDAAVRVPRDLSLAGFDDIPIVRDLNPPLTTVHLPLARLGSEALSLALSDGHARRRTRRVSGEVVVRASTTAVSDR